MSTDTTAVARAFSGHRFPEAYPHLADDVRWDLVGGPAIVGAAAVREACDATLAELADAEVTLDERLVAAGPEVVAVDVLGRYVSADGTSVVASCDLFTFVDGRITAIRSYTVEVDDPGL